MNLHTHDYLAFRVNEVVIILDMGAMEVLCSFCRTIPVVHSCNHAMMSWNLKSLLAVNSKCSPRLFIHAFKAFSRKLLVAGVRPWASHYLSLVLMLCNLRQDTFIDYLISECGLGQITASLRTFFCFNVVQPWARHFYWISYCLYWTVAGQITSLLHVVQPWVRHF
jgi:hypothetical protein